MSKSKNNTVDPFELLKKYSADTVRWYLVSQSPVWRTTLFDADGVGGGSTKILQHAPEHILFL